MSKKPFPKEKTDDLKTDDKKSGKSWKRKDRGAKFACNDPNWYVANEQQKADAGRVVYANSVGLHIDLYNDAKEKDYNIDHTYVPAVDWETSPRGLALENLPNTFNVSGVPGVMALHVMPTLGSLGGSATDAISAAANRIYSFVRHQNSGSKNYDAPNLMEYLICVGDMLGALEWAERAYGTCLTYDQNNRYLPKQLLVAQGFDPEVAEDMTRFRSIINNALAKASVFNVPAGLKYFDRKAFMFKHIYKEDPNPKSQIYLYVPEGFLVWDETNLVDNRASIKFFRLNVFRNSQDSQTYHHKLVTLDDLESIFNMILTPLILSEDFNVMSGDILKAYGDKIWKFALVHDDYAVYPEYNHEVLMQMKNAEYLNSISELYNSAANWTTSTYDYANDVKTFAATPYVIENVVKQCLAYYNESGDNLTFDGALQAYNTPSRVINPSLQNHVLLKHVFTSDNLSPTVDETLVNARLKFIVAHAPNLQNQIYYLAASGTEVVCRIDTIVVGPRHLLGGGINNDGVDFAVLSTDFNIMKMLGGATNMGILMPSWLYGVNADVMGAVANFGQFPIDFTTQARPDGAGITYQNFGEPLLRAYIFNRSWSQFKYRPAYIAWAIQAIDDYTPAQIISTTDDQTDTLGYLRLFDYCIDFNTYAIIDDDPLDRMHYIAMLSLFDVPALAGNAQR